MPKYSHLAPKYFNNHIGMTRPGEVYYAKDLPYDQKIGNKSRPVIVVEDRRDYIICMKCSTKSAGEQFRYKICDGFEAGLDHDTYIVPQLIRVPKTKLQRRLGTLSKYDRDLVYTFALQDCGVGA